jgi:hypothetical protein
MQPRLNQALFRVIGLRHVGLEVHCHTEVKMKMELELEIGMGMRMRMEMEMEMTFTSNVRRRFAFAGTCPCAETLWPWLPAGHGPHAEEPCIQSPCP